MLCSRSSIRESSVLSGLPKGVLVKKSSMSGAGELGRGAREVVGVEGGGEVGGELGGGNGGSSRSRGDDFPLDGKQ